MSICINQHCPKRENSDNVLFCQGCGSELLLNGRYKVIKPLGTGGFGATYEVSDSRHSENKVLKVLINHQPKAVELFKREAEVLKTLDHPGIPRVERNGDFIYLTRNSQQPLHCLVMEKVEGMDLYSYMKRRDNSPISEDLAVQWLKEIVNILQLVHEQNYFHRDIKPPNIMLRATGNLVLIDFGGVRETTQTYYFAHQNQNVTGVISAGYTPMEQMNGQATPKSDFFALGRTFVFLLTGKEPSDPAISRSYNGQINWRYLVPNISPEFANLIDRMMANFPTQRPADTREILQSLALIENAANPPRRNIQPKRSLRATLEGSSPSPVAPTNINPPLPSVPKLSSPHGKTNFGWGFWLWWLLANIASLLTFGLILPLTQWLVLRKRVEYLPETSWWILVTAIGLILGFFLGLFSAATVSPPSSPNTLAMSVWLTIGFTILGSLQWLVLKGWVSHSSRWIWANALTSFAISIVMNIMVVDWSSPAAPIVLFIGFVLFTSVTGFILMNLLRNPVSKT